MSSIDILDISGLKWSGGERQKSTGDGQLTWDPSGFAGLLRKSTDGMYWVWQQMHGRRVRDLEARFSRIWMPSINFEGDQLAIETDRGIHIWDASMDEPKRLFANPDASGNDGDVMAFSTSWNRVITIHGGLWSNKPGRLVVTSTDTMSELMSFEVRRSNGGTALPFVVRLPDGREYASGSFDVACSANARYVAVAYDSAISIWDTTTGRQLHALATPNNVEEVLFSPEGERVLARCGQNIRVWDVAGGQLRCSIDGDCIRNARLLSPRGEYAICEHSSHTACLVGVDAQTLTRLESNCGECTFSPDSKRLVITATGGEFCSLRMFDTQTGVEVLRTRVSSRNVLFSQDCSKLLVGDILYDTGVALND